MLLVQCNCSQRDSVCLHCLQIRGIKTNIPFMENVLRHPVFLAGHATTGFIENYSKDLFKFEGHSNIRANKLLLYLADMVRRRGRGGARPASILVIKQLRQKQWTHSIMSLLRCALFITLD